MCLHHLRWSIGIVCFALSGFFSVVWAKDGGQPIQAPKSVEKVTSSAEATNASTPQKPAVLKVATKPLEPFSFQDGPDGKWTGFSIELWLRIAKRLGVETEFVNAGSVNKLIDTVKNGDADIGIAGITMNLKRERLVDFSHPFYNSGLQVMVENKQESAGILAVIKGIFTAQFLTLIGGFFLILLFCGHIIWLAERRRADSDFASSYAQGVWDGFWWSAVTVTTVGYGDKAPKGHAGKVVGLVWMFVSLFLISYFTASVTTALTLQSLEGGINGPQDLPRKVIASTTGSTAAKFARRQGATVREVGKDISEGYRLLKAGAVDAVVFDAPVLQYYSTTKDTSLRVVGQVFEPERYGIAMPHGSPYRKKINEALHELEENGGYDELRRKWFGQ